MNEILSTNTPKPILGQKDLSKVKGVKGVYGGEGVGGNTFESHRLS